MSDGRAPRRRRGPRPRPLEAGLLGVGGLDAMLGVARDALRLLPNVSLYVFDTDLRYVFCEGSSLRARGLDPATVEGRTLREVFADQADDVEPMYRRALAGETVEFETRADPFIFNVRIAPTRNSGGQVVAGAVLSIDVTQRHADGHVLRESLERLDRIASNLPGVVYQVRRGADGAVSYPYVSDGIRDVLGIEPRQLQADPSLLLRLIHPDDLDAFTSDMVEPITVHGISHWEGRVVLDDGSIRWLRITSRAQPESDPGVTTRDGVAVDVTDQRVAEETARWRLHHDAITGLPNRALFLDRLEQALARGHAEGSAVGVCFIDLDRFKQVNDTLGHAAGDDVLRLLAVRVQAALRPEDTVARHGSDELTVLLPALPSREHAAVLSDRIVAACEQPMRIAERDITITCSVGVAVAPDDGHDAQRLLSRADTAMYRAKERGRGRVEVFNRELAQRSDERAWLDSHLPHAIARDELHLVYQPQLDMRGAHGSVEALLRWHRRA